MSDVPRVSEALEGYIDLASEFLSKWTPYVNGVAAKVDAGTYDAAPLKRISRWPSNS